MLVQLGGQSYLVDAGKPQEGPNVVDFLRSRGVETLDGIIVSNPDADHVGGFLHLSFENAEEMPERLVHQVSLQVEAAPPDQQQITEEVGPTEVDRCDVAVVSLPLKGSNYLAADSCCDANRHTRAAFAINGHL